MNNDFNRDFESQKTYYIDEPNQKEEPVSSAGGEDPTQMPPFGEQVNEPEDDPDLPKTQVTSMVLGIIAAAMVSCCGISIVLGIISICLAVKTRRLNSTGRMSGMGIAGMICSIYAIATDLLIGLVLLFIFFIGMLGTLSFL